MQPLFLLYNHLKTLFIMAKKVTVFATSGYSGGRRGATDPSTGKTSHGGRYITREQRRADLRAAFGVKG
nr:MAG TPA: hypothetical protein [Caudoviricetes sp.]